MDDLSKRQLSRILSALENKSRTPNSKTAALKAIGRHAGELGLTTEAVLAAAAGLLDGRMSAEEFVAELKGAGSNDKSQAFDSVGSLASSLNPLEPAAEEPAEAPKPKKAPKCRPLAIAPISDRAGPPVRESRRSKQAIMIEMLRRPEGATVDQIANAMGWARHTVRGAMAGALKKRLGLTITSKKSEGAARTYRIAD